MSLKSTGFVIGLPSGESGKTSEVVGGPLNMDATGETIGLQVAVTVGNPDHIQSRDTFTPSASRRLNQLAREVHAQAIHEQDRSGFRFGIGRSGELHLTIPG